MPVLCLRLVFAGLGKRGVGKQIALGQIAAQIVGVHRQAIDMALAHECAEFAQFGQDFGRLDAFCGDRQVHSPT